MIKNFLNSSYPWKNSSEEWMPKAILLTMDGGEGGEGGESGEGGGEGYGEGMGEYGAEGGTGGMAGESGGHGGYEGGGTSGSGGGGGYGGYEGGGFESGGYEGGGMGFEGGSTGGGYAGYESGGGYEGGGFEGGGYEGGGYEGGGLGYEGGSSGAGYSGYESGGFAGYEGGAFGETGVGYGQAGVGDQGFGTGTFSGTTGLGEGPGGFAGNYGVGAVAGPEGWSTGGPYGGGFGAYGAPGGPGIGISGLEGVTGGLEGKGGPEAALGPAAGPGLADSLGLNDIGSPDFDPGVTGLEGFEVAAPSPGLASIGLNDMGFAPAEGQLGQVTGLQDPGIVSLDAVDVDAPADKGFAPGVTGLEGFELGPSLGKDEGEDISFGLNDMGIAGYPGITNEGPAPGWANAALGGVLGGLAGAPFGPPGVVSGALHGAVLGAFAPTGKEAEKEAPPVAPIEVEVVSPQAHAAAVAAAHAPASFAGQTTGLEGFASPSAAPASPASFAGQTTGLEGFATPADAPANAVEAAIATPGVGSPSPAAPDYSPGVTGLEGFTSAPSAEGQVSGQPDGTISGAVGGATEALAAPSWLANVTGGLGGPTAFTPALLAAARAPIMAQIAADKGLADKFAGMINREAGPNAPPASKAAIAATIVDRVIARLGKTKQAQGRGLNAALDDVRARGNKGGYFQSAAFRGVDSASPEFQGIFSALSEGFTGPGGVATGNASGSVGFGRAGRQTGTVPLGGRSVEKIGVEGNRADLEFAKSMTGTPAGVKGPASLEPDRAFAGAPSLAPGTVAAEAPGAVGAAPAGKAGGPPAGRGAPAFQGIPTGAAPATPGWMGPAAPAAPPGKIGPQSNLAPGGANGISSVVSALLGALNPIGSAEAAPGKGITDRGLQARQAAGIVAEASKGLGEESGVADFKSAIGKAAVDMAKAGIPANMAKGAMYNAAQAGLAARGLTMESYGGMVGTVVSNAINEAMANYAPAPFGPVQGPEIDHPIPPADIPGVSAAVAPGGRAGKGPEGALGPFASGVIEQNFGPAFGPMGPAGIVGGWPGTVGLQDYVAGAPVEGGMVSAPGFQTGAGKGDFAGRAGGYPGAVPGHFDVSFGSFGDYAGGPGHFADTFGPAPPSAAVAPSDVEGPTTETVGPTATPSAPPAGPTPGQIGPEPATIVYSPDTISGVVAYDHLSGTWYDPATGEPAPPPKRPLPKNETDQIVSALMQRG